MLKNVDKRKCPRCRCVRLVSEFGIRKYDIEYKTCIFCRTKKCQHGRTKYHCRDCGGTGICEHGKQKYHCRDCGGAGICSHNRQTTSCKECAGSSICEHGRRKYQCKECGGSSICEHGRQKLTCIICYPKRACKNCFSVYVYPNYRFKPYCFRCYCVLNPDADVPRKYNLKEHYLRDALKEHFPDIKIVFDQKVDNGCSKRRPDVRIECLTHTVIVECDENQHKNYNCENKRTMELFQDLGSRPLVIIRFNPGEYKRGKTTEVSCFKVTKGSSYSLNKKEWNKRVSKLIQAVKFHLHRVPTKEVTTIQLYYDS